MNGIGKKALNRILLLIVCIVIVFISCTADNDKGEFEFYYYPKKNVYYDFSNHKYFYSLNGGKSWDSLQNLNEKDPGTLGEKVTLYSSTPDIWRQNNQHRKEHNAVLYNIIAGDGVMVAGTSTEEVTERNSVRKPVANRSARKKQGGYKTEKKGVKDFFKNIFGKKDKK